jgi:hypothetical protein
MTKIIVENSIAGKWWLAWLSYKHRKMAKVSYFDSGNYALQTGSLSSQGQREKFKTIHLMLRYVTAIENDPAPTHTR